MMILLSCWHRPARIYNNSNPGREPRLPLSNRTQTGVDFLQQEKINVRSKTIKSFISKDQEPSDGAFGRFLLREEGTFPQGYYSQPLLLEGIYSRLRRKEGSKASLCSKFETHLPLPTAVGVLPIGVAR
jgi:hypothetical protein